MSFPARWMSVSRPYLLPFAALALAISGCGGGGGNNNAGTIAAVAVAVAEAQPPTVVAVRNGVSPFIAFVDLDLHLPVAEHLTQVHYSVESKPGSVARPVDVAYAMTYLEGRGYASAGGGAAVTVPVFGLYANHANQVRIDLRLASGSQQQLRVEIVTAAYTDPNGIYDRPNILKPRTAGDSLSFDYFYMKSALGSPVVVDTDGQLRWVVPAKTGSLTSLFHGNRFVVGDGKSLRLLRLELDGATTETFLSATGLTNFHHNLDPGKVGLLAELDAQRNGVAAIESTLAEIDPEAGTVLKQWDLADTLSRFMQSHGDDPALFVRPGVDWFHMNAATYDPSDDTLIVSSRENFVVKIDYASGDLVWILGDPTKYWHGFQSLAARSLTLGAGGLYPIGQHSVSITHDGLLQVFNDGLGSVNQPAGAPAGDARSYSAVSAYAIDAAGRTAVEARRFDYGQRIYSSVCSSAYQAPVGASMLISYAVADNATHARLVGLDESQNVAFDFEYSSSGCNTSWNAQPIPFEAMRFDQ